MRQLAICEYETRSSEPYEDTVWLDIETRKVPAPSDWPQKTRWQPFMVGVARVIDGTFTVEVRASSEEGILIDWLSGVVAGKTIKYAATREFDEMVLRGRFTNARRAHSLIPGDWPHLSQDLVWKNIRKGRRPVLVPRPADCPSRDVPFLWEVGEEEVVTDHCLRDVIELVLQDYDVSDLSIIHWLEDCLRAESD